VTSHVVLSPCWWVQKTRQRQWEADGIWAPRMPFRVDLVGPHLVRKTPRIVAKQRHAMRDVYAGQAAYDLVTRSADPDL
jgi:hypothetical protein